MDEVEFPFVIAALEMRHDRAAFECGAEPLDRYLRTQATQEVRRRMTACFVALEADSSQVAGFYTISATAIPLPDISPTIAKKLPRYPLVPAVRVGRLAVDRRFGGRGLGGFLLADAVVRALRSEIMAFAMQVDAKDEVAAAFYRHHGFIAVEERPLTLYLPLAEAAREMGLKL